MIRKINNSIKALLLLAIGAFASCEDVTPPDDTIVSIRPRVIPEFSPEGGSTTIYVRTNQSDFQFEVSQDWVTVERVATDSLRLTTTAYEGIGSRAAQITLTAGEGDLQVKRSYSVIQKSKFNMAFDKEDVDENGWLWFDSVNKITKYIGEDKLITYTNGPSDPTVISDILWGADATGLIEGGDATRLQGAIRLGKASGSVMSVDGGAIYLKVPSCSEFELSLSSEASMRVGLHQAKGTSTEFFAIKNYGGGFQPNLSPKGKFVWNCAAEKNKEITTTGVQTLKIINMTNQHLYIHGIKLYY